MQTLDEWKESRALRQCENCGAFGHIGKELIRHNKGAFDEKILCHKCHLEAHRIKGAAK